MLEKLSTVFHVGTVSKWSDRAAMIDVTRIISDGELLRKVVVGVGVGVGVVACCCLLLPVVVVFVSNNFYLLALTSFFFFSSLLRMLRKRWPGLCCSCS